MSLQVYDTVTISTQEARRATTAQQPPAPPARRGAVERVVRHPFFPIWPATAALFAISPLLAHGSLGHSALLGMLPFAAILAIAAIGQTLVVQQGGLDLSVPGVISLSAVVVAKHSHGGNGGLLGSLAIVALACVAAGLISGVAVTRFGITPLVATLGVMRC